MKDYLYLHLRDLPYFRALIRGVEATYYQDLELPAPTLDVGCGDGHFVSLTFEQKIDVGLDPWYGPIHESKRRNCYHLLVQAEGAHSPFINGYFASAFSNSVLEHIPEIDAVLSDIARVLKPGAYFYFCVPNDRYLSGLSISRWFGKRYTEWFRRISRVEHADGPSVWERRLRQAGFALEQWWHYFSVPALHVLEWGHYFGIPSLLAKKLTGKWILNSQKWNLFLTEKYIRRYASNDPEKDGTFTFYIARKQP